jgi:hypothetical protein
MFSQFIQAIVSLVKVFKSKPKLSDVLTAVLSQLPSIVSNVIGFGGANTKEKFDDFLQTLDDYTGSDQSALDIFKDMPADVEEAFWDHIKEAARIIGYNQLKVDGYHVA